MGISPDLNSQYFHSRRAGTCGKKHPNIYLPELKIDEVDFQFRQGGGCEIRP